MGLFGLPGRTLTCPFFTVGMTWFTLLTFPVKAGGMSVAPVGTLLSFPSIFFQVLSEVTLPLSILCLYTNQDTPALPACCPQWLSWLGLCLAPGWHCSQFLPLCLDHPPEIGHPVLDAVPLALACFGRNTHAVCDSVIHGTLDTISMKISSCN